MIAQEENNLTLTYPSWRLSLRYAGYTTIALLVYFLIIKLLGFEHIAELRYFNAAIMFGGVFFAFRNYFGDSTKKRPSYFDGYLFGIMVCVFTAAMFGILMYLYLKLIDPQLGAELLTRIPFEFSNMGLVVFLIFFEGAGSGVIISFIAMQYYK